jgi:hypothetical protein
MGKSHLYDKFLVLLGPIISRFFACSNEEKNKPKQQRMHALVLSLWGYQTPYAYMTKLRCFLGVFLRHFVDWSFFQPGPIIVNIVTKDGQ